MAAICCDICLAPCKAIGYCCQGLERACDATCAVCCKGCCPRDRPSPVFLAFTLLFNVPIAIIAVVAAIATLVNDVSSRSTCSMRMHPAIWLFVAAAFALIFIGFAIRVYSVLAQKNMQAADLESGAASGSHPRRTATADRVWHLACRDVGTFLYLLALPATLVWAFLGIAEDEDDTDGCGAASWAVRLVAALMLVYIFLHLFVACASCCWEFGRNERPGGQMAGPQLPQMQQGGPAPTHGAPAKMLQHLFVPGFETNKHPVSPPPPATFAQAPPTAHMAAPPPHDSPTYSHAQQQQYENIHGTPPGGQPATGQQQNIFGRMQAAFR